MSSFSKKSIDSFMFSPSTAWYLSQCSEARGMQEMWSKIRPAVLKKLKESAIIQSRELIKKVLSKMQQEGLIKLQGKGRGARWKIVKNTRSHRQV